MHLVDGLRIRYNNNRTTLYDGENKPIIDTNGYVNKELLEEFIWLYKIALENYNGKYEDMIIKLR
jgi:hypothetical protein